MISKALIVDEPWVTNLLEGRKVWEMRSTKTKIKGRIGLIRKGSGTVVGVAEMVDCIGPLSRDEMLASIDKHTIPESMIRSGDVDKWCFAWVLKDVTPLPESVSYEHPFGAVIWVTLKDVVSRRLQDPVTRTEPQRNAEKGEALQQSRIAKSFTATEVGKGGTAASLQDLKRRQAVPTEALPSYDGLVPFAKDGSFFGPHLGERGYFQVGKKGEEQKFESFADALAELKRMPTPYWRRPNEKGNWGIVSGKGWARPDDK